MRISLNKIICGFFLILFGLYFAQGVLIPVGTIVGPLLLIFIFIISFIYLVKLVSFKDQSKQVFRIWIVFFLVPIFSYIFSLMLNDNAGTRDFSIFRQVLLNFLPFFPAYYFSKNGILTKRHLILFFYFLLLVFSVNFFNSLSTIKIDRGGEDVVSNAIYPILGLLPFIFLINKRVISFGVILFVFFMAVQSNKRAAILIALLALVFFVYNIFYSSSSKNKIWSYFIASFFAVGLIYYSYDIYQQNFYLQGRMSNMFEGDSSGRDTLIMELFSAWYNSNSFLNYLFGLGFNSNEYNTISGNVAHNDWIDILGSYGLVGVFLFLLLWGGLIRQVFYKFWSKSKKINYILILIIMFLSSMTFRWYVGSFPFMASILLPYLLATKYEDD